MSPAPEPSGPVIAIVGPTASGKTSLAVEVARRLDGEIISLDSRQAYRGFEIGTAAPSEAERRAAPHHGVGFLDPDERYGAGRFARHADAWLAEIRARGRTPLLAGGTGLFLRALTHPLFAEPPLDPVRRGRLEAWLGTREGGELRRWAARLDPGPAGGSAPRDRQRAGRTVELALLTGFGLGWWLDNATAERPPLAVLPHVLDLPPEVLRDRIRSRTRRMLAGPWQQEVEALLERGWERSRAFDALGYRDVAALVGGEATREEVAERVFAATWRYARRQRTWFRHQLPPDRVVLDGTIPPEQLARRIAERSREGFAEDRIEVRNT